MPLKWSEPIICRALARHTFKGSLCMVPNCSWTGHECDLLVITEKLRVIDVEVKISRQDLKADAGKDKWWHRFPHTWSEEAGKFTQREAERVQWPRRVWRHYYAMPADIWKPEMADGINQMSGILLVGGSLEYPLVTGLRKAHSNPQNDVLTPAEVVDVARLASLRMWDSLLAVDLVNQQLKEQRT